jgi:hypothetical protein
MRKSVKCLVAMAIVCLVSSVVYATGTSTATGRGPDISMYDYEFVQAALKPGAPVTTKPVTGVDWTWHVYTDGPINPITNQPYVIEAPVDRAYLCMAAQTSDTPNLTNCINISGVHSGTTSNWNGMNVNALTLPPKLWFTFIATGTGGISPAWRGQINSVTVRTQ